MVKVRKQKDYVLTELQQWTPEDVFTSWHDRLGHH